MSEKKKILLVEDDEDVQFVLEEGLEDYDVYTSSDGKEGLEKAKEILPDIIISDIMMPNMSGADLNEALKKDPVLKNIPLILITGRPNMREIFSTEDTGRNIGFIEKPFTLDVLEKEIKRIFEKGK